MAEERTYIAIDLKSFYASVECVDRGLDPLTTNLVVADESRTEKTICLAVSPSLKAFGIGGRARLFEVVQRVSEINAQRRLNAEPLLTYITAMPRMARYIEYSNRIYDIYLNYIAPEDIHVYSCDEVFIDATQYLKLYRKSGRELAMTMIRDVFGKTGITATAGIGTNLYLCKVAMDIVAKHIPADKDGVRIAELNERSYREQLWDHRPLTDFWRVGHGIAEKLMMYGIDTMGKIARQSVKNEELFYRLFGVNAELLIDHAWGWEPCTMEYIKQYKPETNSLSSGQVLKCPYTAKKARVVMLEMADALSLELVEKGLLTDQIVMTVGYDRVNLDDAAISAGYDGKTTKDYYGREVPKHAHGTEKVEGFTASSRLITGAAMRLFDRIVNQNLLIRRLNICAEHLALECEIENKSAPIQLEIFTDYEEVKRKKENEKRELHKERRLQKTLLKLKNRFGKNVILKGTSYEDGATAFERNLQIGGHKA